jgi:hypothetical protein
MLTSESVGNTDESVGNSRQKTNNRTRYSSRAGHENRVPSREACLSKDTLTITDNRTGKTYEVPIQDGTIKAMDLRQIKVSAEDFGLMTYDRHEHRLP